jgi:hypothetical protein
LGFKSCQGRHEEYKGIKMTNLFILSLIMLAILTACTPGQQFEIDIKQRPDVVIDSGNEPVPLTNPPTVQVK